MATHSSGQPKACDSRKSARSRDDGASPPVSPIASRANEPPPKVAISRRRFTHLSGSPTPVHAAGLTSPPTAGVPPSATGASTSSGTGTGRFPPSTVPALTHAASSRAPVGRRDANVRVSALVTFNPNDFRNVCARRGIELLSAA
jgi:hypothetical protein